MNFFFATEIIQYIWFAEPGLCGNLIQRGTPKPVAGKHIQRGVQDDTPVAPLDSAGLFLGGGVGHGAVPSGVSA